MPISDTEKAQLLIRLEKARLVKQAKALEAKKAKEVKPAPAPAPEPAPAPAPEPAPAPAPEPTPEQVSVPIDIPAPKKQAKKVCVIPSDSDSEEEVIMPKKKKTQVPVSKKEPRYLKIVLYKEPANPVAFQQLLEAVNDNGGEYDDEVEDAIPEPPAPREYHKGPRIVQKVGAGPRNTPARSLSKEDIETAELRRLSMLVFG